MLLSSASRRTFAPENDDGGDDHSQDDLGELDTDEDDLDGEDGDDLDDDADEGEGDEGGDEGDDPPARQPSRGQNRVATLAAREKAEKLRADAAEAELTRLRAAAAGPQETPQQAAARREAHLATLTEAGRLEYLINENRQQTNQQIQAIQFASFDASDKATFQGLCARNPAVAALEADVEKTLIEMRAGGTNAPRETVVKYLLGERALAKTGRARTAGRKREAEGRDQQRARPANGRGDVAPSDRRGGSEAAQRRKRLENVNI